MKKVIVKGNEKGVLLEVYETYYGDLYFVTEKGKDYNFGYVRLYSMPDMAEWGDFGTLESLKESYGENFIWKVKESNWKNINSYEDGLLTFED